MSTGWSSCWVDKGIQGPRFPGTAGKENGWSRNGGYRERDCCVESNSTCFFFLLNLKSVMTNTWHNSAHPRPAKKPQAFPPLFFFSTPFPFFISVQIVVFVLSFPPNTLTWCIEYSKGKLLGGRKFSGEQYKTLRECCCLGTYRLIV